MPSIHSSGTLARRAELFDQLATLIEAGVPLIRALELQSESAAGRTWRKPIRAIMAKLNRGETVGDALRETDGWVSRFDRSLLTAGARSGRLETAFSFLADHNRQQARMRREILAGIFYPALLLHIALLVFPVHLVVGAVVNGEVLELLLQKAMVFGVLYGAGLLLLMAARLLDGDSFRAGAELLYDRVPLAGAARRSWALSRVAAVLDGLLAAGVSIQEAWPEAAAACGSPALRRTVASWKSQWARGATPAETLAGSRAFPGVFSGLYATGEVSGTLDSALPRLRTYYQEEAMQKMKTFAVLVPRILYVLIVIAIGYSVIGFWSDYFGAMSF